MHKISFIGAGNMGGALVRAVCKAASPSEVIVFDTDAARSSALSYETGCDVARDMADAVSDAKYVMFCVKPQIMTEAIAAAAPHLIEGKARGQRYVIVSIAAGVGITSITDVLSKERLNDLPVIRLMPNIAASVGRGTLFVAPGRTVLASDCSELEALLAPSGLVEKVDEQLLDLGTAISGCGPAFAFMFIEAIADGGVSIGMPRDKALLYAAQTLAGAADMVMATGRHPGELKDSVCSPGGSTIAGVLTLERNGFRAAVSDAVIESNKRNTQLGGK